MIDIKIRYQAVAFMPSIEANSTNIAKMMNLFNERGLVPTTQSEFSITDTSPQMQLRFNLKSVNNEWDIHFGIGRIGITKNATDTRGDNIGTIEQFSADVSDIYSKINSKFPQQANRIALSSNVILSEMKEDILNEIYLKLFNPIKLYADNNPTEWNSRTVARMQKEFSGNTEIFNFVSEINRINGFININQEIKPIDNRIAINIDINTIQDNETYRFGTKELECFYSNVSIWYNDLLSNFFDKLK